MPTNDEQWMSRAMSLAVKAWGCTHPNPMVGAVITQDGNVIAEGYHKATGQAHAEVDALSKLTQQPSPTAALYVTLEPCSTQGRTGACTNAIIQSGIKNVVIGAIDPNPEHAGRGVRILQDAGITVKAGVLAQECEDLNLIFNHWITKGRPLVAAKIATTLDGKIATRLAHSKWVTGKEARADVMRWRRLFPAIAVGAGTVLADNPQLTSRMGGEPFCPLRLVFDRHGKTVQGNPDAWADLYDGTGRTVFVCDEHTLQPEQEKELARRKVSVWFCAQDWDKLCTALAKENCTGLLIEGGGNLLSRLLAQKQIDYLFQYIAPKLLGDKDALAPFTSLVPQKMDDALTLTNIQRAQLGEDTLIRGKLNYR